MTLRQEGGRHTILLLAYCSNRLLRGQQRASSLCLKQQASCHADKGLEQRSLLPTLQHRPKERWVRQCEYLVAPGQSGPHLTPSSWLCGSLVFFASPSGSQKRQLLTPHRKPILFGRWHCFGCYGCRGGRASSALRDTPTSFTQNLAMPQPACYSPNILSKTTKNPYANPQLRCSKSGLWRCYSRCELTPDALGELRSGAASAQTQATQQPHGRSCSAVSSCLAATADPGLRGGRRGGGCGGGRAGRAPVAVGQQGHGTAGALAVLAARGALQRAQVLVAHVIGHVHACAAPARVSRRTAPRPPGTSARAMVGAA